MAESTKAAARIIDFSNVKDGGNFNKARIPAGDYLAKIIKVEDAESKADKTFQYLFTIQIVKRPSSKLPYYCKLQDNQLWKLRNIFIAAGKVVPKKKQKVDPNQLVGKLIGVSIEDTEFEDKPQSEIAGLFPAAELADTSTDVEDEGDEAEDEDEDAPLEDDETEEEAEEETEEEETEGDEWDAITDRLELRKALKKLDPEAKTSTSMSEDDIRDLIRKASATDDEEELEEDEEEEEETPAPVKKKAPAKKTTTKKKSSADVSDDELEDLDIDDL